MAASCQINKNLTLILATLLVPLQSAAQVEDLLPEMGSGAPIIIDADSSDLDYTSGKLIFRGLRMNQDTLNIEADTAETENLDFDNGIWTFTGNVRFKTANATLTCDWAEISFAAYELSEANFKGEPAWFEQVNQETGKTNTGAGKSIVYKLAEGTLELREDAWFTDGGNKVAGELITYDIRVQNLKAGAGNSGPVKIFIDPPRRDKEEE